MEDKKMMVEEKNNKEKTKRRRKKEEQKRRRRRKRREKRGEIFWNLGEGWASEMKKKNSLQCLVWLRLNGLSSSQNGQNSLIHNWCIGGCWFTQAGFFHTHKGIKICTLDNWLQKSPRHAAGLQLASWPFNRQTLAVWDFVRSKLWQFASKQKWPWFS